MKNKGYEILFSLGGRGGGGGKRCIMGDVQMVNAGFWKTLKSFIGCGFKKGRGVAGVRGSNFGVHNLL